jgi:hypothetical protein
MDLTTGWWYGYKTMDLVNEVNRRLNKECYESLTDEEAQACLLPMLCSDAHVTLF